MGFLALLYSTHLTFSGKQFPDLYGKGAYQGIYREAFFDIEMINKTKLQKLQLDLLKWYEPRAKNKLVDWKG